METITCGVPQGSVLGPLLFLLYVNDIHRSSKILSFILFADDTNIFNSHSDISTLTNTTNEELKKVAEWLRANKLSLNLKKTQFIIFKAKNKKTEQLVDLCCFTVTIITVIDYTCTSFYVTGDK